MTIRYSDWRRGLLGVLLLAAPPLLVNILGALLGWWDFQRTLGLIAIVWLVVFSIYLTLTTRLYLRPSIDGNKYLQANNLKAAEAAFERQIDLLRRHPWVDRLRLVLFADTTRYSVSETTWLNLAYVYMQRGDIKKARRAYEQALRVNPTNGAALAGLNFIRTFSGEKPLPFGHDVPVGQIADTRHRQMLFLVRVAMVSAVIIPLNQRLTPRVATLIRGSTLTALLAEIAVTALAIFLVTALYQMAMARLLRPAYFRALRLLRRGQFREAMAMLEAHLQALERSPVLERRRWLVLDFHSTGYAVRALHALAFAAIQAGDREAALAAYERLQRAAPADPTVARDAALARSLMEQKERQTARRRR